MSITISIVIPAHNEAHFLPSLLKGIQRHFRGGLEIIVVDNGSSDATAAVAVSNGCQLVQLCDKVFPSIARNRGADYSTGEIFVFLDADVEVTPEWGSELAARLDSLHRQPMQITGDQYHISQQPSWLEKIWFGSLRRKRPTYINGGNLITTRKAFESIGGFSPQLETGEDVDFCQRAVSCGIQLTVNCGFKVFHEGYPKTISRFIKRERWHGRGDFQSFGSILRSKVAMATIVFLLLHVAVLVPTAGVVFGTTNSYLVIVPMALLLILCMLGSVQKFPAARPKLLLQSLPIMYFYYLGRMLSVLDTLQSRLLGSGKDSRHR